MQNEKFCFINTINRDAPVAQLDRASDYGSEGCEFESRRARQLKKPPHKVAFLIGMPEGNEITEVSSTTSERRAEERRSATADERSE